MGEPFVEGIGEQWPEVYHCLGPWVNPSKAAEPTGRDVPHNAEDEQETQAEEEGGHGTSSQAHQPHTRRLVGFRP